MGGDVPAELNKAELSPLPSKPSPPNRYGDLLAHWQLKAALRGDAPPYTADGLLDVVEGVGATTQAMAKLEREAESYWVAEYFRQAAAAAPAAAQPAWAAMFLCWLKQEVGLGRVLLEGLGLETVVRLPSPVQVRQCCGD